MEGESTSGDARGRCNLGAPELQSGDVINAGRGATVLGRTLCAPGCQQGGSCLGYPTSDVLSHSWAKTPGFRRRCCVQLCASMHFAVPVIWG